jgi:alpha-tubulin suppressor-like RCC1 family protein
MSQVQRDPTPQRRGPARSPDVVNNDKKNLSRSPAPQSQNGPQVIQFWGSSIFPKKISDKSSFTQIKSDEEIFQIIPGESHVLFVSKKNALFILGNNDYGQLGLGKIERAISPTLLSISDKHQISKVFTGSDFTFAMSSRAEIFSWGLNLKGQLGHGHFDNVDTPTRVRALSPSGATSSNNLSIPSNFSESLLGPAEMIVLISCGSLHSLALTNNGRIFSCGYGETYALGLGNTKTFSNFQEIPYFKDSSMKIEKISAGVSHSGCLINGQVYVWGTLGTSKALIHPKPNVMQINSEAIDFVLGDLLTVVLNSKGEVFTMGDNIDGQLGCDNVTNSSVPIKVNLLYKAEYIACGMNHVIALSKSKIFAWGSNRFGQINPRDPSIFIDVPTELEWVTDSFPFAIFCGPLQTYLISKKLISVSEKKEADEEVLLLLKKEVESFKAKTSLLKKENDKLKDEIKQLYSTISNIDSKNDDTSRADSNDGSDDSSLISNEKVQIGIKKEQNSSAFF